MQLIGGRARQLPVVLLVQVTQSDRVRQQLIQVLDRLRTRRVSQRNGHLDKMVERLNLVSLLMGRWCRLSKDLVRIEGLHLSCSFENLNNMLYARTRHYSLTIGNGVSGWL